MDIVSLYTTLLAPFIQVVTQQMEKGPTPVKLSQSKRNRLPNSIANPCGTNCCSKVSSRSACSARQRISALWLTKLVPRFSCNSSRRARSEIGPSGTSRRTIVRMCCCNFFLLTVWRSESAVPGRFTSNMAHDVLLFPTSIHGGAIETKHCGLQQSLADERLLGPKHIHIQKQMYV